MKHNLPNNFIGCLLIVLCCMMLIPGITYAQTAESEAGTLVIDQEKYILERTGESLIKIYGNIELDWNPPKVVLTHTNPNGESVTHNLMTNDQGYYEFYSYIFNIIVFICNLLYVVPSYNYFRWNKFII